MKDMGAKFKLLVALLVVCFRRSKCESPQTERIPTSMANSMSMSNEDQGSDVLLSHARTVPRNTPAENPDPVPVNLTEVNLFTPKALRLFQRAIRIGSQANVTSLNLLPTACNSKYTEFFEDPAPRSAISKLHRKLRLESRRTRNLTDIYPDVNAEKQRKRLVKKAMTQLCNLAAVKAWQEEQKLIEQHEKKTLMGAPGLRSLGWRGDDRFKNPELIDENGDEKKQKNKKEKKRKPKDEVIKRWNEIMRDPKIVEKMDRNPGPSNLIKCVRRISNRHARRVERERACEPDSDSATSST